MRYLARILVLSGLAVVIPTTGARAQGLSAEEVTRVTAEVSETMETYYSLFSQRDMQALPDRVFNIPWMTLGANGINVSATRDEALVRWQGSLIDLLQRGWDRSVFTIESVCVLNAGAAIVSGFNTRYLEDGSEMSVGGVTYILGLTDDGWRIVSYTGSEVGRLVTCE